MLIDGIIGENMKKANFIVCVLLLSSFFVSCGVSNKSILRQQKLEEGVENPTTVEELKDAIAIIKPLAQNEFEHILELDKKLKQDIKHDKMLRNE